jgi:hypothetical protein
MTGFRSQRINRLYQQQDVAGLAVQLSSDDLLSRLESASALLKLADQRGFDFLVSCLRDHDPMVRGSAVELLAEGVNFPAVEVLQPMLSDTDAGVRQAAADSLTSLTGEPVIASTLHAPVLSETLLWLDRVFTIGGVLFTLSGVALILFGRLSAPEWIFVWICLVAAGCFTGSQGLQRGGKRGYAAVLAGCLALVLGIPVLTAPGILALKHVSRPEVRQFFQLGSAK